MGEALIRRISRLWPGFLLLAACEPQEPELPAFEVFDSGGIEVVVSHSPAGFPTAWTLSEEPILRIGKGRDENPYLFMHIGEVTRLGDGSVVVMDASFREIRRFDAQGLHIVTFGGYGEGPGEFKSPRSWLRTGGDTLIVLDSDGTVARFDPDGRLLVEIPTDGLHPGNELAYGEWVGVLPDGVLWGGRYPRQAERPEGRIFRNPYSLVISDHDRTEVRTVGEFLMPSRFVGSDGVEGQYYPLFLTTTVPNRQPAGLLVGDNETFTIDLIDSDGTHLRRIRYPGGVREPDPESMEEVRRVMLEESEARAERTGGGQNPVGRVADLPNPAVWPGFMSLTGDEDGYVWAYEYRPGDMMALMYVTPSDAPYDALVFHPDGHLLGSVQMPGRLIVREIGTDYVLGIEIDDMGVNEVVLYRLTGR
ncbi:hypothetical protein ACFL5A_03670 [Gemmatimonadota bacterium]